MYLECKDLSFGYTEKLILNNISFSIEKGETLAIVGASGCGKSTLLRVLSAILTKASGNIEIDNMTPDEYRKSGKLSFMFQEPTLMPNLTVRQNVEMPLRIKNKIDNQKVTKLISKVGLTEFENLLPKHLSGGMKTRVSMARSFVTNPELLLLDEPFSALDIGWKSKLYLELEKMRVNIKTTIVLVTHDVQEALLLSDKIIVMNKFGGIEFQNIVTTEYSIIQRINDISGYMSKVYENYMLPIQDSIIQGNNEK